MLTTTKVGSFKSQDNLAQDRVKHFAQFGEILRKVLKVKIMPSPILPLGEWEIEIWNERS